MFKPISFIFFCLFLHGCSLTQILVDNDNDGIFNHKDICKNTPKDAPVDKFGCALDSDKDGVINLYDICPNSKLIDIVNAKGCLQK